jgi:hypothetical protein
MAFDATKSALGQLIGEKIYLRSPEAQRTRELVQDLQESQAQREGLRNIWSRVNLTDSASVIDALHQSSAIAPEAYSGSLMKMVISEVEKQELQGKRTAYADLIDALAPGGMSREERAYSAAMATRTGLPQAEFPPLNEPRTSIHLGGGGQDQTSLEDIWIKEIRKKYAGELRTQAERDAFEEAHKIYVTTGNLREDLLPTLPVDQPTAEIDRLENAIISHPEFQRAVSELGKRKGFLGIDFLKKDKPDIEGALSEIRAGNVPVSPRLQTLIDEYKSARLQIERPTDEGATGERPPLGGF